MRRLIDRAIAIDRARIERQPLNRPATLELTFDLSVLASWYKQSGQPREAIRVFQEVLATREELLRADPRDEQAKDRLLYVLVQLGQLYRQLGDRAKARPHFRKSVELAEELSRNGSRPNEQLPGNLAAARDGLAWAGR
jgi:tetratricopeptide (TPR) repeat protein